MPTPTLTHAQYLDLLKRFTPATLSQDHLVFLQDLERVAAETPRPGQEWTEHMAQSDDTERKKRAALIQQADSASSRLRAATVEDSGVKIWSGPSADKERPALRIQSNSDMIHMERDFTTTGTPSKLGCPFASGSGRQSPLATPRSSTSRMSLLGRRSKRPSFNDPIRAEICGNDVVSASASVEGSAAVCPIRFLDQHNPEDVAKYFEKHKHELPRSHEVCINRFQSNAESIQQLDRKYGNLVSMIQGLGEKHQAWLPEEPDEIAEEGANEPAQEPRTDEKVQKWAKAVSESLQDFTPGEDTEPTEQTADEARTAHFDRPLKEVRVGESPSRPWGISIPAKYTDAESSSSVGSAPTASPPIPLQTDRPLGETPKKTGKCPFDHATLGKAAEVQTAHATAGLAAPTEPEPPRPASLPRPQQPSSPETVDQTANERPGPQVVPQMVFNGPVFLGYPPEQLMSLLQNSNLGSTMRS